MVVLDSSNNNNNMLSSGGSSTPNNTNSNQYLQPDYLSPLSTSTLDSKKSPLALLAQTCSQIGADSPTAKPMIASLEKSNKKSNETNSLAVRSSPNAATTAHSSQTKSKNSKSSEIKLGYKPYESSLGSSNNSGNKKDDSSRPNSKTSVYDDKSDNKSDNCVTDQKLSPKNENEGEGTSPIIRSGLEVLQGKNVPLKMPNSSLPSNGFNGALCYLPGLEHLLNPAFRPPMHPGSFHQQLLSSAAAAAAAAAANAATPFPGAQQNPFMPYSRIKANGSGSADPLGQSTCKDPYCAGCQFNAAVNTQQLYLAAVASAASAQCPSGCTQCDHQKQFGLSTAMNMPLPPLPPPSSLNPSSANHAYPQLNKPFVCNWIFANTYCGKVFNSSEELLQHLRIHTSVPSASNVTSNASSSPSSSTSSAVTAAAAVSAISPTVVSTSTTTTGPSTTTSTVLSTTSTTSTTNTANSTSFTDNNSTSNSTSAPSISTTHPQLQQPQQQQHPLLSATTSANAAAAAAAAASYRNFLSSPLNSLRYHPYAGKPSSLPPPPPPPLTHIPPMPPSPHHLPSPNISSPYSAFSPAASPLAAVAAAYYGPFSMYNPRLGAAVHQ